MKLMGFEKFGVRRPASHDAIHNWEWQSLTTIPTRRERSPQMVKKSKGNPPQKWPEKSGSRFLINCSELCFVRFERILFFVHMSSLMDLMV